MKPRIAVSILHYNSLVSLQQVIEAVKSQTLAPDKILILDNGSEEDVSCLKDIYSDLELIKLNENLGVGHGHNFAWKHLINKYSPEFIWALEHDSIPEPNNLMTLFQEFKNSGDQVMAINSVEKNSFDYKKYSYFKVRIPNVVKLEDKDLVSNYFGGLSFNGVLIPVSTLEKVGYLREDFFIGFEDIDFSRRIYKSGGKVLRITNSYVYHDVFKKHRSFKIGNRVFLFPGNEPFREYYSFRNSLVVHQKPLLFFIKIIFSVFYILLFRRRKIANISAKVLGFRDAMVGRLGKREYSILNLNW